MRHIFRIFSSALGICALLFFTSCAPAASPTDALAYQKNAASVTLSGSVGELEFSAIVTLSACDNVKERDFTVEYTSPAALRGVTVCCRAGVCEAKLGSVSTTGKAALALARPAEAFTLDGEISKISAEGGETLVTFANGEVAVVNGEPRRIDYTRRDVLIKFPSLRQKSFRIPIHAARVRSGIITTISLHLTR